MKSIVYISVCLFFGMLMMSCVRKKMIHNFDFKGKEVKIKMKNEIGFSSNRITYYIQLGDYKEIPIDAFTTDIYGAPYTASIFEGVPYHLFVNDSNLYQNEIDFSRQITPTMLYFNPKKYSKESFDAYADFFGTLWQEKVKEFNKETIYYRDAIIGVVYGKKESFVQTFVGKYQDADYYFEVLIDGQVLFHRGVPPDNTGFETVGFLNKVQMPGKRIVLTDTTLMSLEKLQSFKDEKGKSMMDYFNVEVSMGN